MNQLLVHAGFIVREVQAATGKVVRLDIIVQQFVVMNLMLDQ